MPRAKAILLKFVILLLAMELLAPAATQGSTQAVQSIIIHTKKNPQGIASILFEKTEEEPVEEDTLKFTSFEIVDLFHYVFNILASCFISKIISPDVFELRTLSPPLTLVTMKFLI